MGPQCISAILLVAIAISPTAHAQSLVENIVGIGEYVRESVAPWIELSMQPNFQETQQPQDIAGSCSRPGLYPVEGDCTKYYSCVKKGGVFTKYDFSCGPGSIWDPDYHVCNHPSAVKRTDCNQEKESTQKRQIPTQGKKPEYCKSEGAYRVEGDCKKYYTCVKNGTGLTKYDFTCAPGTIWDPDYNVCNHPSTVQRNDCSQEKESTQEQEQPTQGQKSRSCNSVGLYPIVGDCTQYYSCVKSEAGFTTYDFSCRPGTIFDPEYKVCNHPSAVKRKDCNQVKQSTQKREIPTQGKKPEYCKSEGAYRVEGDCKKYYTCVKNGTGLTKYDFTCAPGTIWDPDYNVCNHPSTVQRNDCRQEKESTQEQEQPTQEQKPGSCNSEGLYPIEGNCTKYYSCVKNETGFTKYDFCCGPGTIFDPEYKVCNHPSAVKRSDCSQVKDSTQEQEQPRQEQKPGTCKSEGLYPIEGNCTKYYSCVRNETGFTKYDFFCGPGTIFDPEYKVCNHPSAVKRSDCSQVKDSTQEQEQPMQEQKPGTCKSEGLYPIEGNCTKYYSCVRNETGFTKYDFFCGPGTIFDPEYKVCNHPSAVKRSDCSQVKDSTQEQEQPMQEQKPGTCNSEGLYPIEGNCTKYYSCVKNETGFTKYDFCCGPGTIFDPEYKVCNHPSAVKRNDCSQVKDSTQEQEQPRQEQKPGTCKSEGLYPIEGNCTKYYSCVKNETGFTKYDFCCGPGTIFDSEYKVCNHPSAVKRNDCSQVKDSTQEQEQPRQEQKPGTCKSEGLYPIEGNCTKYYSCVKNETGFTKYDFCCGPGTIFDPEYKVCNHPSVVKRSDCSQVKESIKEQKQPTQEQKPGSCKSEGLYPIEGDCMKYYSCVKNETGFTKYDYSCGPGTIFDPEYKVCNHPSVVKRSDCSQVKDSTQEQEQPTPGQKPGPCNSEGFFPVQGDCSKFYRCVSNGAGFTKYDYSCRAGTSWDLYLKACYYQWAVKRNDCSQVNELTQGQGQEPTQEFRQHSGFCNEDGFFPVQGDCTRYYRCVKYGTRFMKYDFYCERGLVWEPGTSLCNYPWIVKRKECPY